MRTNAPSSDAKFDVLVRIKKKSDGNAALSCVRRDGSVTWQRQEGVRGQFFPLHDLTHFAVETVLGHRRGFYGLVAEGWDITDFGAPWPRGPMPADADPTEFIVGFLDSERASGRQWSAEDLNDELRVHTGGAAVTITQQQLELIRARRDELFRRWHELPTGETLELPFVRERVTR